MTPEWLMQRANNLFLLKYYDILTTLVGFAHIAAMSRVGLEVRDRNRDQTWLQPVVNFGRGE